MAVCSISPLSLWLSSTVVFFTTAAGSVLAQPTDPLTDASDAIQQKALSPNQISLTPVAPQPSGPELEIPELAPDLTPPNPNSRFPVRRIEVTGSTVLQLEIAALVDEYIARGELSLDELLELRARITQLYIDKGYITSGAFLPTGQSLSDGDITIQVVEGQIESVVLCVLSPNSGRRTEESETAANDSTAASSEISPETSSEPDPSEQTVSSATSSTRDETSQSLSSESPIGQPDQRDCGSARLRESYVRGRLARLVDQPVNQQKIEEVLQLLQINPLIQQVNAQLTAGSAAGRSILQVDVREAPPFSLSVGGDNYQSPSIGSEQFSVQASYANLIGVGDRISAGYGITEGLDSFNVGFAIPVNPMDGTISVGYSNDDSLIVDEEFEDFEIRSESETISVGFRQPVVRTPENEIGLSLGLDVRRSTNFLDGEPFSFSEGPEDGRANVTVVRFAQDWLDRDIDTVLAARSQFSLGIDAFDATINDSGTDGRFFAWLGQFQWVQRLSARWVLVSRLNAQLTPDSLLSLERFGYGGAETIRGYRQNQLVTDNGVLSSVEARFSLLPDSNRLQLISFVDAGTGWNNRTPDPQTPTLLSAGLGFRWLITSDLSVRLDYGIPLIEVENEGNSLQDNGLYFSLRYEPF